MSFKWLECWIYFLPLSYHMRMEDDFETSNYSTQIGKVEIHFIDPPQTNLNKLSNNKIHLYTSWPSKIGKHFVHISSDNEISFRNWKLSFPYGITYWRFQLVHRCLNPFFSISSTNPPYAWVNFMSLIYNWYEFYRH